MREMPWPNGLLKKPLYLLSVCKIYLLVVSSVRVSCHFSLGKISDRSVKVSNFFRVFTKFSLVFMKISRRFLMIRKFWPSERTPLNQELLITW